MIFRSTYNKPILLVGNGVRAANAVEMVHEFARKTNIPVLTTMNGVDLVPADAAFGGGGVLDLPDVAAQLLLLTQ